MNNMKTSSEQNFQYVFNTVSFAVKEPFAYECKISDFEKASIKNHDIVAYMKTFRLPVIKKVLGIDLDFNNYTFSPFSSTQPFPKSILKISSRFEKMEEMIAFSWAVGDFKPFEKKFCFIPYSFDKEILDKFKNSGFKYTVSFDVTVSVEESFMFVENARNNFERRYYFKGSDIYFGKFDKNFQKIFFKANISKENYLFYMRLGLKEFIEKEKNIILNYYNEMCSLLDYFAKKL